MSDLKTLDEWLEEAAAYHGHLCAGQVLGVRMGLTALSYLGIKDPHKRLIVYVETDRCAADALQTVTGCKLGKRTLKHIDYGKMAAVFVDLEKNVSIRISVPAAVRQYAKDLFPSKKNPYLEAYKVLPEEKLFHIEEVIVHMNDTDLPGKPLRRILCETCGEEVNDGRDIEDQGKHYCKACYEGAYYQLKE